MNYMNQNVGIGNGMANGNGAVQNSEIGGRRFGIASSFLTAARVAGQTTYLPAHTMQGKPTPISQRLLVTALHNTRRQADGAPSTFNVAIWGPLADVGAKFLSPGRAFDGLFSLLTYKAPLFTQDGQIRLDNQGQQIVVNKTVQTVLQIEMGEESHKFIQREIQDGIRPEDWRMTGSPGYLRWQEIMRARASEMFQPGSQFFGFARVVVPNGAQINMAAYQKMANVGGGAGNGYPAQVGNGYSAPAGNGYATGTNPQEIKKVFSGYQQAGTPTQAPWAPPTGKWAPQAPAGNVGNVAY